MPGLPTGTVTILFTDIEGSTRLWEQHPDEMAAALARHETLLRFAIESAGGYVFKTVGDAFCATFAAARDAVGAAGSAQRSLHVETWPEKAALKVRMALHTGECEERDGDYFGPAVNRVARLEATAHGGQVVVSRSTAEVLGDRLPSGMQLVNLGSHELKDLDRPEEVFQLVIEGVPASFPPLRTPVKGEVLADLRSPTNLTRPVSSFVGRDDEMAQIANLLGATRLVTLAGPGGVGKTRLATEVGSCLLAETPEGVWLVELAPLVDSGMVASKVVDDLGIAGQQGKEPLTNLLEVLADQERLVILDNCEHLLEDAATVADAVLRRCPKVRMLATSREPLRIDGEVIYQVPSLSLPPEDARDRDDLAGSGAVALFVERASAQVAGFEITDHDAVLVASICRRLDGVPLALELATARLRSMSLAKLHDRLEHRFGLLTGGSRVALPRQQTLGALVDWSYELLSESERTVFRRTSVFVDGFDLEAAERVCALDDIAEFDVADHLSSLVDKSMVVATPDGDDIRYRLQETLHEYGSERLAAAASAEDLPSESDRVAAAHCDYYLGLAEQAGPHLEGRSVLMWLRRLNTEDLNLRAATEHAFDIHDGAKRVLDQFWTARRYWIGSPQPAQVLELVERALEQIGSAIDAGGRARALYCKAVHLFNLDRQRGHDAFREALDAARESGDMALEVDALARYSRSLAQIERGQEAVRASAEALALARQLNDPKLLGTVLARHALTLLLAEEQGAEASFLEGLTIAARTGDDFLAGGLQADYSLCLIERGELVAARYHLELSLQLRGAELNHRTVVTYGNLGLVLLLEGDPKRAQSLALDVLRASRLAGIFVQIPYSVLALACCASQLGVPQHAAVLHGGADALIAVLGEDWEPLEATIRERDLASVRDVLGDEFEPLYAQGLAMPGDEITRLAMSSR